VTYDLADLKEFAISPASDNGLMLVLRAVSYRTESISSHRILSPRVLGYWSGRPAVPRRRAP